MVVENLSALKINKLSKEQYLAAKEAGTLKENEFYLIPDIGGNATNDGNGNNIVATYATKAQLEEAIANLTSVGVFE